MDEARFYPTKVFVTKDSENLLLTRKVLENTRHLPVEFIADSRELIEDVLLSRDPVGEGKKLLLVTHQRGEYVKPCPCTPQYIGCNYFIINTELNCPLDCSYCILQLYMNNPLITIHANTSQLYTQLDDFLKKNRNRPFRIGTGELGDSLALDHLTGRSSELISYFAEHPNVLFELKTKTVNIQNVLAHKPPGNIVIAWSLNSAKIAGEEEMGAPPVHDRVQAAHLVSQAGYRVGFHFDPLIYYEGWEDGYGEVIENMLAQIDRKKIAWISLGSLRFPPALKPVILKRFPQTKIIYDEFIPGKDGKLRYPKTLRLRLFQRIVKDLEKAGGGKIPVYLCMESRDIWMDAQKKAPRGKREVEKLLTLPLGANENDF
ncbi:MAG: hypothetical protein JSV17_08340 [Candidatus Aminicenantes bacterium]|nr:MAG: hypothetical protein JSV17_08340 [Candidatus Aminicenantes bacterium]